MKPVTVTLQESLKGEKCSVDKYLRRYMNIWLIQCLGKIHFSFFFCT